MTSMLRVMAVFAAFFASTFLIAQVTGIFNLSGVKSFLETTKAANPVYLFVIITLLLLSDLFVAIPTLSIATLSGYFLGFGYGGLAASTGMMLAGVLGYVLSRKYGVMILRMIIKSELKRAEAVAQFSKYGAPIILLSRASPILPEVSACMAGITKLDFKKFLFLWSLSSVPYAFIAAYAGSVSSISNPQPAIFTAIGMYALLWSGWIFLKKSKRL